MTATNDIPLGPDGKIQFADTENEKRGCLTYALIGLLLLGLLFGGTILFVVIANERAEKKAKHFVEAVLAGNVERAYSLTSSDFREVTSKASLAEVSARLKAAVGGRSLTLTERTMAKTKGGGPTVAVTYTAESPGRKVSFRTFLRLGLQGWRVVNFESSELSASLGPVG